MDLIVSYRPGVLALVAALALLLWGCAGSGLRLAGRPGVLDPDLIVDLKTGAVLTPDELADRLAGARVVFIGEFHTHPEQHHHQLEIVRALYERDHDLVLALEVFERKWQPLLDKWVSGRISEADFKKVVSDEILTADTAAVYWPLLLWAGQNRVPLLALNAPRSVTAKVAKNGLDSLPDRDRSLIARDIRLGPEEYRERVVSALGHHHGGVNPDNFFAAQVVWDETMAETLAGYLSSEAGRRRRAVVIAGNEHIFRGHGLPDRTARRLPGAGQVLIICPVTTEDEVLTAAEGDYAWPTKPLVERPRRRLGTVLRQGGPGELYVESVMPGSRAEKMGLKPGDRLLSMDGRKVESPLDMHRAALAGDEKAEHTLTIDRAGIVIKYTFRFSDD